MKMNRSQIWCFGCKAIAIACLIFLSPKGRAAGEVEKLRRIVSFLESTSKDTSLNDQLRIAYVLPALYSYLYHGAKPSGVVSMALMMARQPFFRGADGR